jgi:hypothetical protein
MSVSVRTRSGWFSAKSSVTSAPYDQATRSTALRPSSSSAAASARLSVRME